MAATALRSHQSQIRNSHCNHHNPKPNTRCHRSQKRSPEFNGRNETQSRIPDRTNPDLPLFPKNMVMGQVKILKRGDPLPELNNKNNQPELKLKETKADNKVGSSVYDDTDFVLACRLCPESETVSKQINAALDFYAGSAPLLISPHPSSLPKPSSICIKN